MTFLLVALGGGVGSAVRYLVAQRLDAQLPWGTLAVNVVASFLLGIVSAATLSESASALLGIGFCGGMSTYSAFAVQTHERGPRLGTTYAVLTVGLSLAACALGHLLYA
ncbi:MAG TPA: CrcB family protein [Nocardioidaceae bacterium]|nr:CrcB family protein [Nocardioidaceae bacterium]